MGTLIQKMLCQPKLSTSQPPTSGPMASERPDTPAQMPMARARSRASGKVLVRIDRVLGIIIAPPTPWNRRAAISTDVDGARAQAMDPAVKRATPMTNALRRPYMSPRVPPVSSRLASASTKASTIHWSSLMLAPSSRWIVGSARFTTVLSSITMNRAKHMVPRVMRLIRFRSVMVPPGVARGPVSPPPASPS